MGHRIEPSNLAPKVLGTNGPLRNSRFFNAALTVIDDKGVAQPYLAQNLPQLNADNWRVFPDGRMETTYVLRDNLTWQDGAPLTAEDFTFAYRVYKDRGLGVFIASPQDAMDAVLAPDPRTVVVQWNVSPADPILKQLGIKYVAFDKPLDPYWSSFVVPLSSGPIDGFWLYQLR